MDKSLHSVSGIPIAPLMVAQTRCPLKSAKHFPARLKKISLHGPLQKARHNKTYRDRIASCKSSEMHKLIVYNVVTGCYLSSFDSQNSSTSAQE